MTTQPTMKKAEGKLKNKHIYAYYVYVYIYTYPDFFWVFSSRFFCLPLLLLIDLSYSHKETNEMETQNDGHMYFLSKIWPCLASF